MKLKWTYRLMFLWVLCTGAGNLWAQQDAHYSQYIFNGLVLNPAYAGSRGVMAGSFFYRNQWTGFEGAPETETFSFHAPLSRNRYGVGFTLSNDKIGYVRQQWLTGSYAFRIRLDHAELALGLQGGLLNYRINWPEAQVVDQNDFLIGQNAQNILLPNVGTGAFFSTRRFYAGLSMPHILNSELINANNAATEVSRLYRHVFFTSGVVLGKNPDVKFKPSVLVKYAPAAPISADFNLMVLLKERFWFGAGYRTGDAITAMMDLQLSRFIRLGYAFDYTLSELRNYSSGTHEIVVGFEIRPKNSKLKSPRYF